MGGPTRGATPATSLQKPGRACAYDNSESRIWRRHLEKSDLAAANLCGNLLNPLDLSFLQSSTSAAGGWEKNTFRRDARSLMLERLDSDGSLAGPLQLVSSSGSLASVDAPDDLPSDFGPPSPMARSMRALHEARTQPFGSLGSLRSHSSSQLLRRPSTAGSVASSFGRPTSAFGNGSNLDNFWYRPRPAPLISAHGGVRSSLELKQRAGSRAGLRF